MLTFSQIYRPLTSRPFQSGHAYKEYPPCADLRPYIACYWTDSESGVSESPAKDVLVIPDTCMDIIIRLNHTKQKISGILSGIQDRPFISAAAAAGDHISLFAVRFHFWSASLFLPLHLDKFANGSADLEELGREWIELFEPFLSITDVNQRIERTESFLLQKLEGVNSNANLLNSIHQILTSAGRSSVKEICEYSSVSQRQLERLFLREIGLPIKRIATLVRYQNVWNDLLREGASGVQNAVYRYGYTDQAHLLNEFKRFHGITPDEAVRKAYELR